MAKNCVCIKICIVNDIIWLYAFGKSKDGSVMAEREIGAAPGGALRNAPQRFEIAVFEGDGIGPEVMAPTLSLLRDLAGRSDDYELVFTSLPAGAGHYRDTGEALPEASLRAARAADAILLSAIGLPNVRYPDGTEIAPQIDLRKELDLYAGVRPVFIARPELSPLRTDIARNADFVVIRESTEGLFASHGRPPEAMTTEARETMVITRKVSEKLFDFAFRLARQRKAEGRGPGLVTCVDKANVFQAFAFFRRIFEETAARYPDIRAESAYVDAVSMWMVQRPRSFDVMVTENMFGDILSDLGAGLMGSLGLAPSADIGDAHAVFQPCHGTAPDIAGQGKANPIAMFLSAAMMLDWLGREREIPALQRDGVALREATLAVMADTPNLTPDLGGGAATAAVGEAVARQLNP